MKKIITIILAIMLNLAILGNSFAYDLTDSDKKNAENITLKLESFISKKGENYRNIIVEKLKKIDSNKSEKLKAYIDYIVLALDKENNNISKEINDIKNWKEIEDKIYFKHLKAFYPNKWNLMLGGDVGGGSMQSISPLPDEQGKYQFIKDSNTNVSNTNVSIFFHSIGNGGLRCPDVYSYCDEKNMIKMTAKEDLDFLINYYKKEKKYKFDGMYFMTGLNTYAYKFSYEDEEMGGLKYNSNALLLRNGEYGLVEIQFFNSEILEKGFTEMFLKNISTKK